MSPNSINLEQMSHKDYFFQQIGRPAHSSTLHNPLIGNISKWGGNIPGGSNAWMYNTVTTIHYNTLLYNTAVEYNTALAWYISLHSLFERIGETAKYYFLMGDADCTGRRKKSLVVQ